MRRRRSLTFISLDFMTRESFSQSMKLTEKQMKRMVQLVFKELKDQGLVSFKTPEDKVFQKALEIVKHNFATEATLDQDVNRMMDQLERQNPGEFQRYKMFPLLKKRMAKERGFIL
jgi:hypothetical protein